MCVLCMLQLLRVAWLCSIDIYNVPVALGLWVLQKIPGGVYLFPQAWQSSVTCTISCPLTRCLQPVEGQVVGLLLLA